MTERYYEGGSPGLTLRNSSTHHMLMNNWTPLHIHGCSMGLKREVIKANHMITSKLYPYIAIYRTNHRSSILITLYTVYKFLFCIVTLTLLYIL